MVCIHKHLTAVKRDVVLMYFEASSKLFFCICRLQKLPTVPETLLKRRKKLDEIRKARAFARDATRKVPYCM